MSDYACFWKCIGYTDLTTAVFDESNLTIGACLWKEACFKKSFGVVGTADHGAIVTVWWWCQSVEVVITDVKSGDD